MNKVQLSAVTDDNLNKVLDIQIHEHQQTFLPTIRSSLNLASKYPDAHPLVIEADDQVCGFALYGIDEETGYWKIFRLYIDKRYQSQGLGLRVMVMLLDLLHKERGAGEVLIVYNYSNAVAKRLYSKLGFDEYDRKGDKVLAKITLSDRHITCS